MDSVVDEGAYHSIMVLLYTVSQFLTRLGHPHIKWENRAFASKGKVVAGMVAVTDWYERYTQQIRKAYHMSTAAAIDTVVADKLNNLLLGPFDTGDSDVDAVRFLRAVCVPTPFVHIMLVGVPHPCASLYQPPGHRCLCGVRGLFPCSCQLALRST